MITAAGTFTDAALAVGSSVLVFVFDDEDTGIFRVTNTLTGGANTLTAAEVELIGIIQGDLLTATEMATILI